MLYHYNLSILETVLEIAVVLLNFGTLEDLVTSV